jgi:hypothetical protein
MLSCQYLNKKTNMLIFFPVKPSLDRVEGVVFEHIKLIVSHQVNSHFI